MSGQGTTRCWECEAPTAALVTVALRTGARHLTSVALCQNCFDTCYLALASDTDAGRGELSVESVS
jgi:hypothetical protein